MYFYRSKPRFFVNLMLLALLNACTTEGYYAPIKTYRNESAGDKQKPLITKQRLTLSNQAVAGDVGTHWTVSNRRTFHTIVSSPGHGYHPYPTWNQNSPPHNITAEIKINHADPGEKGSYKKQQHTVVKNASSYQQTKIIQSATSLSASQDRTVHKKHSAKSLPAQQSKSQQKKSIVSIDNKKMLEFSFGWPIKGRVLKSFSPSHNKGIDIAGKNGQLVKAAEAGKVVYGGQGLIGYGELLIIKHNDVYLSAYANNSRLLVNEGEYVQKGQAIAKVGNVGIKRTSLHFEIRENGKPINPLKLLPKK
jgi:lipoprotein NlpD